LIIFTSDHGEFLGDNNCFGKRSMHDPASRVPMIVRGPGFKPGETCESPVNLVDIMPTAAAACGLEAADTDGVDLSTVADGSCNRKYVFSQFGSAEDGIYMIVSREWKYFYSAGDRREYFFDRVNDPDETRNKAGLPMLNKVKNSLKKALLEYLNQENATEAFVETEKGLDWREYPHLDMSYLEDPDNGLLIQDHDAYVLDRPGYTD
jgi:choline-sulfatase